MATPAYNTSLVPLVQKPESPDKSIKKGSIGEAQVARLSHVNALAKDVYQLKVYTADFETSSETILNICSKKGIVNFTNFQVDAENFDIVLNNPEIEAGLMYVQVTVYAKAATGTITPLVYVTQFSGTGVTIRVRSLQPSPMDGTWGEITLYYELIKICS